jgi:AcrR family transcriptional regulator
MQQPDEVLHPSHLGNGDANRASAVLTLEHMVGSVAGTRPDVTDAIRLARRTFLAGERVDMGALADGVGVNRVTVYRWVGSRERLLVEVLWSLAALGLQQAVERADAATTVGGERIAAVVTDFLEQIITNNGMQRFLAAEGELAMRLLTRGQHGFQPRLIEAIHRLLAEEASKGQLDLPVELPELAFTIVRLIESYTYLGLITGERPDARRAEPILRLLLR